MADLVITHVSRPDARTFLLLGNTFLIIVRPYFYENIRTNVICPSVTV